MSTLSPGLCISTYLKSPSLPVPPHPHTPTQLSVQKSSIEMSSLRAKVPSSPRSLWGLQADIEGPFSVTALRVCTSTYVIPRLVVLTLLSLSFLFFVFLADRDNLQLIVFVSTTRITADHRAGTC